VRGPSSFDYAIIRVVPVVAREEFLNAGVILYSAQLDFLEAAIGLDEARLRAVFPSIDLELIRGHLEAIPKLCAGGRDAGPIGQLSRKERWHWLVAPRSTQLQVSPVHSGISDRPREALQRILSECVLLPSP
jgi:hypothetical protein